MPHRLCGRIRRPLCALTIWETDMKKTSLLLAGLAVVAASGCMHRETTDDGSWHRPAHEQSGHQGSGGHHSGSNPGTFGDPGPNYPNTGG